MTIDLDEVSRVFERRHCCDIYLPVLEFKTQTETDHVCCRKSR